MTSYLFTLSLCGALAAATAGCGVDDILPGDDGDGWGYSDAGPAGGSLPPSSPPAGATPGGVQDMGLARELIANHVVPLPEAFVVEGMFSEHDLGLDGEPCMDVLCLRGAVAVAPTLDGEPAAWMQVGMSSSIDLETFERPSLTLVATVDVSGSMGWSYSTGENEYPTGGEIARALLYDLSDTLGPDDRLAIVTFDSLAHTVLNVTAGDDQETIDAAIASIGSGGDTSIEAGLSLAIDVASASGEITDARRIVLITDAQPNVGETSPSSFEAMAADAAAQDLHLTVIGTGVGLGQDVFASMSHLRGGNAFSLFDLEDEQTLMTDDWPYMVSPVAFDLALSVEADPGIAVSSSYGFPGDLDPEEAIGFEVSTVFLSKRRGALLLGLTPASETIGPFNLVTDLDYATLDGTAEQKHLEVGYQSEPTDERGHYYEQPSVGKTVALAILVTAMHDAAELYQSDHQAAIDLMTAAHARIAADAAALADPSLDVEVQLAADLLALMEEGARQGDLYGY